VLRASRGCSTSPVAPPLLGRRCRGVGRRRRCWAVDLGTYDGLRFPVEEQHRWRFFCSAWGPTALPTNASLLAHGGKPEIVYVGANYCPYCAAERWAIVMALSKFGTFANPIGTSSSSSDVNASTPPFTFSRLHYTSRYVKFVPDEATSSAVGFSARSTALVEKWDVRPYVPSQAAGSIPFLYLNGRYIVIGSQYAAGHIAGWGFAAGASHVTAGNNPTSNGAEAVAGELVNW
jgi:hypothetical protein